jgi:hypothetical protein
MKVLRITALLVLETKLQLDHFLAREKDNGGLPFVPRIVFKRDGKSPCYINKSMVVVGSGHCPNSK